MSRAGNATDVCAIAQTIDVDNRLPLRYYYRIADTLLKQANIYRAENNVIDLYAILLRFSSLVSETIPFHRDYQNLHHKERKLYREKLLPVLDELESLKPEFQRQRQKLKSDFPGCEPYQAEGLGNNLYELERYSQSSLYPSQYNATTLQPAHKAFESSGQQASSYSQNISSVLDVDKKFQKLSFTLPLPKEETLSRHSLLGQNGLRRQWQGPTTGISKISYPSHADFMEAKSSENLSQNEENALVSAKDGNFGLSTSVMESILSLDDGRWSKPAEDSYSPFPTLKTNDKFMPSSIIRQPSPPPLPAQVHAAVCPISPSRVADPRPGPAIEGSMQPHKYQHVHIPVRMLEDFLRLAQANTRKNLETCGVLAGSLKNRVFHISTLIIPKQESTSDSCSTLNEEEIFEAQDKLSLFPLGWIHTHPTQTCFMSSVDLHTHYSYQVMLPEAIAIVMAPTDTSSPHGIFHLSDPGGVALIKNCQQRGFHPHEEPEDGSPLYEHCSHVFMNPSSRFDVIDLRCK